MKNNYQENITPCNPSFPQGAVGGGFASFPSFPKVILENRVTDFLSFPKTVIGNLPFEKEKKDAKFPNVASCRAGDENAGRTGFTLIELLVVVLIIGILAAVALPQYQTAVDKTRYSTLMNVVKAMKDGQELYYLANAGYASDFSRLDIEMPPLNNSISGNMVTYPNGQFFMLENDGGAGNEYVYGRDPRVNITYLLYLDHTAHAGKRFCWAYDNNERANRVCRSMGGTNGTLNGGNSMVYELP